MPGASPDGRLRVTVLEQDAAAPAGWLGEALAGAGAQVRTVRLHAGDPLPDLDTEAALVILGGLMGAYDEDEHPVLVELKRQVREAHTSSVPVLGICLGAQLVADALGGRAYLAPVPEHGYTPLDLTDAGHRDPVLRHLDGDVLNWHQDTFDLPPGATLLARSDRYPQAFRVGRILALQFHPETPPETLERWVAGSRPERIEASGVDPDATLAEARRRRGRSEDSARRLFGAWLDDVRASPPGEPGLA